MHQCWHKQRLFRINSVFFCKTGGLGKSSVGSCWRLAMAGTCVYPRGSSGGVVTSEVLRKMTFWKQHGMIAGIISRDACHGGGHQSSMVAKGSNLVKIHWILEGPKFLSADHTLITESEKEINGKEGTCVEWCPQQLRQGLVCLKCLPSLRCCSRFCLWAKDWPGTCTTRRLLEGFAAAKSKSDALLAWRQWDDGSSASSLWRILFSIGAFRTWRFCMVLLLMDLSFTCGANSKVPTATWIFDVGNLSCSIRKSQLRWTLSQLESLQFQVTVMEYWMWMNLKGAWRTLACSLVENWPERCIEVDGWLCKWQGHDALPPTTNDDAAKRLRGKEYVIAFQMAMDKDHDFEPLTSNSFDEIMLQFHTATLLGSLFLLQLQTTQEIDYAEFTQWALGSLIEKTCTDSWRAMFRLWQAPTFRDTDRAWTCTGRRNVTCHAIKIPKMCWGMVIIGVYILTKRIPY